MNESQIQIINENLALRKRISELEAQVDSLLSQTHTLTLEVDAGRTSNYLEFGRSFTASLIFPLLSGVSRLIHRLIYRKK